jgi:hypothetical protein
MSTFWLAGRTSIGADNLHKDTYVEKERPS